jgi:hypothetical protein
MHCNRRLRHTFISFSYIEVLKLLFPEMIKCFSLILIVMICGCSVVDRREQSGDSSRGVHAGAGWMPLKEGQHAGSYSVIDGDVYCGEVACDVDPIEGADAATFEVTPGSEYGRDKSNVYYPLQVTCVDGEDCAVCYCVKSILENVDPETFLYLGKDYAKDDSSVYFRGQRIDQAHARTFRVLKGGKFFYFAVDRDHVFRHGTIFAAADATTFYYDSLHSENIKDEWMTAYVVRDKRHIWKYTPPETFEELIEN